MNRIERLHAITTTLQSKQVVKAEELARQFGTSLRTIYRDMRALEAGGVPIGAEAGIGYFISEGYHLPPVMFTKEEGRALLMAGKLLEKTSDPAVSRSFASAATKVRAVLDGVKKEELERLDQRILVNPFPMAPPAQPQQVLDQLKEALVQSRVVEIAYCSNHKGEETCRKVEAIGLVFYSNHWHLIGFCQLRQDYRDFRTDRMAGIKLLHQQFEAKKHPSLQQYIHKLITETALHQVEIRVHASVIPYIGDAKWHMGLVQQRQHGAWVHMTFATMSLDYFARWLLMMLDMVEVIAPLSLKEKLEYFVSILRSHYACGE